MQLRTCGVGRRFRLSTGVDMQGSFLARRRDCIALGLVLAESLVKSIALGERPLVERTFILLAKPVANLGDRRLGRVECRSFLIEIVEELGVSDNVAFVNQYLGQDDVIEFLLASDIYVTPYLDPNQITSGTLSW